MNPTARRRAGLAALLFLLSGATSLVYEVLWFRRFSQLWGSSSLALAAVMAAFLLGLGVGARFLGPLADRARRPLVGYAACEAGIGLWALCVPYLLELLRGLYARLYPALGDRPALYAAVQVALSALVLGPPCIAMGATLPLFVRQFARARGGQGVPTSLLYAVNTAGAALGCFAAGFHLLPALGLDGTRTVAVGANLAIALAALAIGWSAPAPPAEPEEAGIGARPPHRSLAFAAGAAGFAALALQIVWARQLAVVLGGSTYAFSAMLTVVLIGIGLGSLALPSLLRAVGEPRRLLAPLVTLLVLSLAAGQAAIPTLAVVVGDLGHLRASPAFNALLCALVSAVLELVPAACAGALFPLLVHLAGGGARVAGRTVGRVVFWNTVGTALGALVAHALLVPVVGTRWTLWIALALYLAIHALLAGAEAPRRRLFERGLAAALALLAALFLPRLDPRVTERGLYIYGPEGRELLQDLEVLFHAEGASANVLVTAHGADRTLRVNGKVDASTYALDQIMQVGFAYLALMLRPETERALVIGYGSGATAGACLLFPEVEVTCAEIEPEVFRASPWFAEVNHRPELSRRFEIRFEDGRAHLMGTRRSYDLILTEPSNPWMAGVSNLFTREFLVAARERLTPEGLLAQWIQTYAMTPQEYRLLLRTVADVFPHMVIVRLTGGDTMVLASRAEVVPSAQVLERAQARFDATPAARRDLERYMGSADLRQLAFAHYVLGGERARSYAGSPDEGLNTDANQRLEFDAPLRLFEREEVPGVRVETALLGAVTGGWQRELAERIGGGRGAATGLFQLQEHVRARGNAAGADALVALGLELAPEHPGLLAESLIHADSGGEELRAATEALLERSTSDAMRAAIAMERAGQPARALVVLDALLARRPGSITARALRTDALFQLGREAEALAELAELVELDPLHEAVRALVRRHR